MRQTTRLIAVAAASVPLLTACSTSSTFTNADEAAEQLSDITGCRISEDEQIIEPAFNGKPPYSAQTCVMDLGGEERLYLSVVPEGEEPLKVDDSFPGYYGIAGRDLILADNNWELHATSYRDEYWPVFKNVQKEWGGELILPDGVGAPGEK